MARANNKQSKNDNGSARFGFEANRHVEGYVVYFWLPRPQLAVARVGFRAENGGHSVPERDILRRYSRSRDNFLKLYIPMADTWEMFDNSEGEPCLVASGKRGTQTVIHEPGQWRLFSKGADDE